MEVSHSSHKRLQLQHCFVSLCSIQLLFLRNTRGLRGQCDSPLYNQIPARHAVSVDTLRYDRLRLVLLCELLLHWLRSIYRHITES